MQTRPSLLIIGAGISGLMAAHLLSDAMQITIAESKPLPGGRISTVTINGDKIEEGPEFIHGQASMTLELLKAAGLDTAKVGGESYKYEKGKLVKDEEAEGKKWMLMMEKMEKLETDMTLTAFLDQYFPGHENADFRKEVCGFAEGFDVADPDSAAVKPLYEEWSHESDDRRIAKGYGALIDYLEKKLQAAGVVFHYNTTISVVDWQNGKVTAHTTDGKSLQHTALLVTVPVSKLAQTGGSSDLQFNPPLTAYHAAAADIGFGAVVKIIISFTEKCWPADAGFIITNEYFKTWWSQLPDEKPVLTGWVGGAKALAIVHETDEAILSKALGSLSIILGIPENELREKINYYHVVNKQHQVTAGGAYSFSTLASAAARKILNEPVSNTIFFAGEALFSGPHPGTVEAALVSAREVAGRILSGGG